MTDINIDLNDQNNEMSYFALHTVLTTKEIGETFVYKFASGTVKFKRIE